MSYIVNTREIVEEYRLSHWAQVMRERQESGQSIKGYCRQIGICVNTYYYWQRKLRASACEALATRESTPSPVVAAPKGWAVCQPESKGSKPVQEITVEIGVCKITATPETDLELLGKVCQVLARL